MAPTWELPPFEKEQQYKPWIDKVRMAAEMGLPKHMLLFKVLLSLRGCALQYYKSLDDVATRNVQTLIQEFRDYFGTQLIERVTKQR